jgi:hypothetical protein
MSDNEFRRPVSVDIAPTGSTCESCGQRAEKQLTAIGGAYHNESGLFCVPCGDKFTQTIVKSTQSVPAPVPTHFHAFV